MLGYEHETGKNERKLNGTKTGVISTFQLLFCFDCPYQVDFQYY